MELKIFRDTLPQGGAGCTVKAELPLETEIRISDDLPPVGKLVKCFVHPVVLQRQLQPGRLTLEGYLRCTVFYQSEAEKGLCQTEQKLPFTRQLELPELAFTAWTAVVEGQTEYLNTRAADPRRIEVRVPTGWWSRYTHSARPRSSPHWQMAALSSSCVHCKVCAAWPCWISW